MTEEFKAYISALAGFCRDETFHGEYKLNFKWMDEDSVADDAHSTTFAQIKCDTVYLWATMVIFPALFAQYERGDLKSCAQDILHEICHLFIEPVAQLFMWDVPPSQSQYTKDTIERQTERLCKTFFAILPEDWYTPFALGVGR